MRLAILIDYANIFISLKKSLKLKQTKEIEEEIIKIVEATKKKLAKPNPHSKKGIQIAETHAFVLDDPNFGRPENVLPQFGINIERVSDGKKSQEMKDMNQSRADDDALMRKALELIQSGKADGIFIFSNDGDFVSVGKKVQYIGRYFWTGIYESEMVRAAFRLKKEADVVVPLQEMVTDASEGIALPVTEEVVREAAEEITGPHLEVYYNGEMILTYPLDKKVIEIGRRSTSRLHYPHVDLTDYDKERIVSRQHAKIQRVGNHLLFSVHKECSRGTWKDRKIVYPGEQFFLEPDMRIILGSERGFGLLYCEE